MNNMITTDTIEMMNETLDIMNETLEPTLDSTDTDTWMMNSSWQQEEGEAEWSERHVLQSTNRTPEESRQFEWDVEEIEDEDDPSVVADSVWATKMAVVAGIWYMAQNATKPVIIDDEVQYVKNDAVKLEALKALQKLHFDKALKKSKRNSKLKVVLIRDGK